jgi:hypothetical protein
VSLPNPVAHLADKIADVIVEEGARVRAVIEAGLTRTLDAQRIAGARPVPIAAGRLATARGRLAGWSLRETGGTTAAVVTVYAGPDSSDPAHIIAVVQLPAGTSANIPPANPGVFFAEGVTVTLSGGPVTGALYFAA